VAAPGVCASRPAEAAAAAAGGSEARGASAPAGGSAGCSPASTCSDTTQLRAAGGRRCRVRSHLCRRCERTATRCCANVHSPLQALGYCASHMHVHQGDDLHEGGSAWALAEQGVDSRRQGIKQGRGGTLGSSDTHTASCGTHNAAPHAPALQGGQHRQLFRVGAPIRVPLHLHQHRRRRLRVWQAPVTRGRELAQHRGQCQMPSWSRALARTELTDV